MLSRVAESIYWMARYIERAENLARYIDVTQNFLLDEPYSNQNHWKPLIQVTGDEKLFEERYKEYSKHNVLYFLTFDRKYPNSIATSLTIARENARSVRETLSSEVWEQLNEFYHLVRQEEKQQDHPPGGLASSHAAVAGAVNLDNAPGEDDLYQTIKKYSHTLNGLLDSTMSHGTGWHFANLGRLLERADKTSRILDVKYFTLLPSIQDVGTTIDDLQWSAVLRSVSGFEMYRKRFQTVSIHRIVEFLVLDQAFPRSVRFCVEEAEISLRAIGNGGVKRNLDREFRNAAEVSIDRLKQDLINAEIQQIINNGLHEFIDHLQIRLNEIGQHVYEHFLAIRPVEAIAANPHAAPAISIEPAPSSKSKFQTQTQSSS